MTTLAPEKPVDAPKPQSPVAAAARFELWGIQNWLLAVILAAPLGLLWAHGLLFALGVGYLIAYIGIMAVPTSLNLLLIYDALRIFMGRPSTIMPWMVAIYIVGSRGPKKRAHPLVTVSVVANPFTAAAGDFLDLALRRRSDALKQIMEDAQRFANQMRRRPPQVIVVEVAEFSREVFDGAVCV